MQLRRWQSECISKALEKYSTLDDHFLCLATPGAGKTVMASTLANCLLLQNKIDLVLCFSPSIIVSIDFENSLAKHTGSRMDGLLGSKGRSLTYQAMLHLDEAFWNLFDDNRIFVIFDEIHHCAGDGLGNANAWGEKIIQHIQGRATYTLALTGTPWRSDNIPIALSKYSQDQRIHCDYIYGLAQAVSDNVCRIPQITLIDNDNVSVKENDEIFQFTSFAHMLSESKCSYQQLVANKDLISYFIEKSCRKLTHIRKQHPNAGGLIVAASVEHANSIAEILFNHTGERAYVATYREEDPVDIINTFKMNSAKWIISIGMISEGTNIPRLRVCCHLTRVKTELHFRQVLGRILRSNNEIGDEGFLYMPAEPNLIEFASRIAQEIPDARSIKFETMAVSEPTSRKINIDLHEIIPNKNLSDSGSISSKFISKIELGQESDRKVSALEISYGATVNIFGRFKQELLSLTLAVR